LGFWISDSILFIFLFLFLHLNLSLIYSSIIFSSTFSSRSRLSWSFCFLWSLFWFSIRSFFCWFRSWCNSHLFFLTLFNIRVFFWRLNCFLSYLYTSIWFSSCLFSRSFFLRGFLNNFLFWWIFLRCWLNRSTFFPGTSCSTSLLRLSFFRSDRFFLVFLCFRHYMFWIFKIYI
jgi:hypothetical protein